MSRPIINIELLNQYTVIWFLVSFRYILSFFISKCLEELVIVTVKVFHSSSIVNRSQTILECVIRHQNQISPRR